MNLHYFFMIFLTGIALPSHAETKLVCKLNNGTTEYITYDGYVLKIIYPSGETWVEIDRKTDPYNLDCGYDGVDVKETEITFYRKSSPCNGNNNAKAYYDIIGSINRVNGKLEYESEAPGDRYILKGTCEPGDIPKLNRKF